MPEQAVEALIEGGKATAAPPLGPALGPLGVNIGQVVAEINKKTDSFKGMQVPVKVTVDSETKAFTISIGTPPASALIMKEAGVQKGSSVPDKDKVADLKIEQVIKISKMKEDALLGKDTKSRVKEIIGTCDAMGVLVEGLDAREAIKAVDAGNFDQEITSGKTEISAEEMKELEEEKKKLQEEMTKKHALFEKKAKELVEQLKGKENAAIRKALKEAGIPDDIINKLAPAEEAGKKK